METKYLSPKSDVIFERIFGDQKNADILAAFLQAVLSIEPEDFAEITIVDPHLIRGNKTDKLGILDLKLKTASGKVIDVEMQLLFLPEIKERIVFYTSKMIHEQVAAGESFGVIKKAISIIIADFNFIDDSEAYHNVYRLYDAENRSLFSDVMEINALELPKLPSHDDNPLWDWLTFFKSERKEDFDMIAQKNPEIKKAVMILQELSQDEETKLLYEAEEKARRDYEARIKGAEKIGLEQGIERGMQQGIFKVAKTMKDKGENVEIIAEYTGLSESEISKL